MADERSGEDTDEKIVKVGGGETTNVDEKKDSNVGDEEDLKFDVEGETIVGEVQGEGRPQTEDVITAQGESTNHSRFELWDVDDHPQDAKSYSHIFNKVREERGDELRWGSLDDGRDTNRLDYFKVAPFNVHGDDNLNGIASYGGGGRTRQLAVGSASDKSIGGGKGGVQWQQWWKKCWRG